MGINTIDRYLESNKSIFGKFLCGKNINTLKVSILEKCRWLNDIDTWPVSIPEKCQ